MTKFYLGILAIFAAGMSVAQESWTGNLAKNPGFEEDFININAEGHVLSFKGDWYYNQKDMKPDYWALKGGWSLVSRSVHSGKQCLTLVPGATAIQKFVRAAWQHGGGAWGGVKTPAIPVASEALARFTRPWRVTGWCRGGGSITVAGGKGAVKATAQPGNQWQKLVLTLPAAKVGPPHAGVTVTLTGPGEFDDLIVQEELPDAPNLIGNASFEKVRRTGYVAGWSQQKKFRAIGPTYYVWTDWNHYLRANRGQVTVDRLVARRGRQSLRFDVYPGDEKLVESELIRVNQVKPGVIEVGVYVRADRIMLLDVRCVDEKGLYMPGYRPRQPEYYNGGTFLYGNGTFEWRYIRKFFGTLNNKPLKAFRVRLCARGFNGHTLDDAGSRSYVLQVGTVWWDDLYVAERTAAAASLRARRVRIPPVARLRAGEIAGARLNLGQRFYGENTLSYSFVNKGSSASYKLSLATTIPGGKAVTTTSPAVKIRKSQRGVLRAPYTIDKLADELLKQGRFELTLLRGKKVVAASTYFFNTWTDVVDIDVSRHYNLPNENPVTVSLNLGIADKTLARVKTLELQLYRPGDRKILARKTFKDLRRAFRQTLSALPGNKSYEFNLPTPSYWVDRTNLIITKLDLSKLKVWPHDQPTRDTVLLVRGLDASGRELFRDQSDPFCRMQPPPRQPAIKTVRIRADGAVLINGQPRFLTGATHQHNRLSHSIPIIAQLGLMGHRLTQGFKNEKMASMFANYGLYALQAKPDPSIGGTAPVVTMNAKQKAGFQAWVQRGGMKNIVSINTGGWEATIDFSNKDTVAKHKATSDWVRELSRRPVAISTSGAFNAWWLPKLTIYDINHAEVEMWGPMDFNVIFTPYMKRAGKTTAWVYLPQLYDNHPYERYRFETYENIIRGSAGVSMIQGIGDPTFNRGLAGELRYLEKPLYSLAKAPAVTFKPGISHKVTRYKGKTYILATNAGPIIIGNWSWDKSTKRSGTASHEGESPNNMWRPGGFSIHGFRGLAMPELIKKGDKLVQYVWVDPKKTPEWVMVAVRGDGRFIHNATLGKFDFARFRSRKGNILMYSELNHSVWHELNWVVDKGWHERAVALMGKRWADVRRDAAAKGREKVDRIAYQARHFRHHGRLPRPGTWHKIEIDAVKAGLVGKLVDGFAYMSRNGRALWDYSVLIRRGKVKRVYCEDTVGIDRKLLGKVRIKVPGLRQGAKVRALFEGRVITAEAGGFTDDFTGVETYGYENDGVVGDLFGFIKDPDRELPRMMPSGYAYSYGPTAVHIYEIKH